MIKLVENNQESQLVFDFIKCDTAPLLAAKMFTEGFGVTQDFLQLYAAFDESAKLCAAFVKCNDRLFCLIKSLYDVDEIVLFLSGFQDFKIFISSEFAHIIDRNKFYRCKLMKKPAIIKKHSSSVIVELDSKPFTEIIMCGKDRDTKIRFLLNNSHLQRHGYIKNYAFKEGGRHLSIASLFEEKDYAYLCNVFTPTEYRHHGYSFKLVSQITDIEKECHLICSEDISPLYEKCGFTTYAKWVEFLY